MIFAHRADIDRITIGLRLAVDAFGGARDKRIEFGFAAFKAHAGKTAHARHERDAIRRMIDFAGDMRLMAEPAGEIAIALAEGNAGIGNLDLDVFAPIARIGVRRAA